MPRINDQILECTVHLYRNAHDAEGGAPTGGTGFLVGVSAANGDHVYVVTNAHVIRDGFPVVRLNTVAGGTAVIDASAGPWYGHEAHDVAIASVQLTEQHKCRCIPRSFFLTEEEIQHHGIGPGNHVFMVGRFVNIQGTQQNIPALRFGTIAQVPTEPLQNPMGKATLAYIVEMHSISGYSGSPVFLHILPFEGRPMPPLAGYGYTGASFGPKLMGIDFGHLAGSGAVENSGMSAVVPVAALAALLDREDVADARNEP